MVELIERKIVAMIPKYTKIGDITEVYTLDGEVFEYERSLRTFLRKLFYFYTVDYITLKNKFRHLGIYQNVPIVLKDNVFMKIKVRKPLTKSDGAFGYVNIEYVKNILNGENHTTVELNNGMKIETMSSFSTLSKNYMIARSVDLKKLEKSASEKNI